MSLFPSCFLESSWLKEGSGPGNKSHPTQPGPTVTLRCYSERGGRACLDLQAPSPLQILLCAHLPCPSVSLLFLVAKPWTWCTATPLEAHYLPFQGALMLVYDSDPILLWSPKGHGSGSLLE